MSKQDKIYRVRAHLDTVRDTLCTGLKAAAPASTVTAQFADVNISNAFKVGNLSFGPLVTIFADPPGDPNAVTVVTPATTRAPQNNRTVGASYAAEAVVSSLSLPPQSRPVETLSVKPNLAGLDSITTLTQNRRAIKSHETDRDVFLITGAHDDHADNEDSSAK